MAALHMLKVPYFMNCRTLPWPCFGVDVEGVCFLEKHVKLGLFFNRVALYYIINKFSFSIFVCFFSDVFVFVALTLCMLGNFTCFLSSSC